MHSCRTFRAAQPAVVAIVNAFLPDIPSCSAGSSRYSPCIPARCSAGIHLGQQMNGLHTAVRSGGKRGVNARNAGKRSGGIKHYSYVLKTQYDIV